MEGEAGSSEDDIIQPASPSEGEEEDEGVFAFRRRKDCEYHAVSEPFWVASLNYDRRTCFNRSIYHFSPWTIAIGRGARKMKSTKDIGSIPHLSEIVKRLVTGLLDLVEGESEGVDGNCL